MASAYGPGTAMTLTYAIGDIHGSLDKLRALFARCEAHAAGRPMKLVFLGDYIDRGPESFGVIDFLLTLRKRQGSRLDRERAFFLG